MATRPAAGGGKWVEVAPERLGGWLDRFADSHGELTGSRTDAGALVRSVDGATADVRLPFGPPPSGPLLTSLVAHAKADRTVGVLLVRLGGFAAGVFHGRELLSSKVDTRLVHGRHKAGGSSQQRFARRREGQARVAYEAATDVAIRILVPALDSLEAVVTGGDRRAIERVLLDQRLAAVRPLVVDRFLTVPDPRRKVLDAAPAQFRAAQILVREPGMFDPSGELG